MSAATDNRTLRRLHTVNSPFLWVRALFNSSTVADCIGLAVMAAVMRTAFRSRFLYDIDSVNFALALGKFDPGVHQPHPPGYFLYVMLGRLVNMLIADANTALVLVSIAASCGTVVMIYLLAADWYGRGPGMFSGLLFLFSPLAWFHGTVALTYVVECFFSALIGFLAWRLIQGRGSPVLLAGVLGLGAGFRPSSLLFLGPLYLYAVWVSRPRRLLSGVATLAAVVLAWFLPMVSMSGGARHYFEALLALWTVAPARHTVLTSPLVYCLARIMLIGMIAAMCFGASLVFAMFPTGTRADPDRERRRFTWIWISPGVLFFTFVFLLLVNSGYLLLLSPPIFVHLGRNVSAWFYGTNANWRKWRTAALVAMAAANTAFFLFAPVYCSYRSVRQFEAQLVSATAAVRRTASPDNTLLIGFDSHFLGYRHIAYYLPEYLTVQFPEIRVGGQVGVFAVRNRETEFLRTIPQGGFENLLLLPLPPDSEDRAFLDRVFGRFPKGSLSVRENSGWSLPMAPIADAKYLFGQQ